MKLKTFVSAAAGVALLAGCSDNPTAVEIPALTPLPAGTTITTTASGLQYADITVGTGTLVTAGSGVAVHYTGWLAATGVGFDTSIGLQPFTFRQGNAEVIAGFDEGVVGMRVGGKRRLFVPAALGYGGNAVYDQDGKLVIPANSDLVFDVEVVGAQQPAT